MDGMELLSMLPADCAPAAFFDPQYRGVLDKLSYGNEGVSRGKQRTALEQMSEETIADFIAALERVLLPSGHLFLWIDKFHLCAGFSDWLVDTSLHTVDMITWNKERMGMGYRSRRTSEHLLVLQKHPTRAKDVWRVHNIRDVWSEKVQRGLHVHRKPIGLQTALIEAVTNEGDLVLDPAAGSFSVLEACKASNRTFLGCDLASLKA